MRRHITYANVMSTIAVFLAVGIGGAWAADQLAKNSVSSKQVKNSSLKSKDLKDGKGVTGADIKDESVGSADVQALVAAEPMAPLTLSNGGESDCVWVSLPFVTPPVTPASGRNSVGDVHLEGAVASLTAAGGDATCDTTPTAEGIEDLTAFVLPPSQRPANTKIYVGGTSTAIVAGVDGAVVSGATIPAGSVLAPGSSGIPLDPISFPAATAPVATSAGDGPDRINFDEIPGFDG